MRVAVKIAVSSALVASLSAMLGVSAAASPPIRAHQHFVGVVNGRSASAAASPVVYTVCAGPIWAGRSGPLAGGQTVAVARAVRHGGYTGLFSQVYAWIVEDSSPDAPQQVSITRYGRNVAIPAAVRVPCDGTGRVEFSSCPHLAPCAAGWKPTLVKVRFENIAD
jgi:hypothetical protein